MFPFFFAKTLRSISILNFNVKKVHTLLELPDMPTDCYSYKKMTLATTLDGRLKIIYVTNEMQNTVVEEVVFARYFLRALRVSAMNTYKSQNFTQSKERQF